MLNIIVKFKYMKYIFCKVTICFIGASVPVRESDGISRLPHLHQWFRTTLAVIMYLTNGTLQVIVDFISLFIYVERETNTISYSIFNVICCFN